MAEITFTIPEEDVADYVDTYALDYQGTIANPDYDPEVPESPQTIENPETKVQYAKKQVASMIASKVGRYRREKIKTDALINNPAVTPDIV